MGRKGGWGVKSDDGFEFSDPGFLYSRGIMYFAAIFFLILKVSRGDPVDLYSPC
jgi:hypothetical protein